MMKRNGVAGTAALWMLITALTLGASTTVRAQNDWGGKQEDHGGDRDKNDHDRGGKEKVLYIWAQDEAHVAPDFLR